MVKVWEKITILKYMEKLIFVVAVLTVVLKKN